MTEVAKHRPWGRKANVARVRQEMDRRGWSIRTLSLAAGLSHVNVAGLMRGDSKHPATLYDVWQAFVTHPVDGVPAPEVGDLIEPAEEVT